MKTNRIQRMTAIIAAVTFVIASLPILPATGYAEAEGTWLVKTKGSKTECTLWQDGSITREEVSREEKVFANRSPLEMLDPYGHSKDDRKDLYGNRGRVIHDSGASLEDDVIAEPIPMDQLSPVEEPLPVEEAPLVSEPLPTDPVPVAEEPIAILEPTLEPAPEPEPAPLLEPEPAPAPTPEPEPVPDPIRTFLYTDYLYWDSTTWQYWEASVRNGWTTDLSYITLYRLEGTVYTAQEIEFLRTLTYEQALAGYQRGYLAMPTVEMPLSSVTELDLARVVNYVDQVNYFTNFDYDVSLTNLYDAPLTMSVQVSPYYFTWLTTNDLNTGQMSSSPLFLGWMADSRYDAAIETWPSVTLQPGETLTLQDTFYNVGRGELLTDWVSPFMDGLSIYYGFQVTLSDLTSGLMYTKSLAGWFQG